MWPGLRPTSVPSGIVIHSAVWPQYMGRKVGEAAVPLLGVDGLPYNNGPRPTFVQSGILIEPAVWPQQTWAENLGVVPLCGEGERGSWVSI